MDPDLLAWVLATLIDTALFMHERFLPPLAPAAEQAYFEDMLEIGRVLGIPAGTLPGDVAGFRAYVDATLETLQVSDATRELARAIFPLVPLPAAPVTLSMRQLTAGLLPPRLREEYRFSWGPLRDTSLRALMLGSRTALPHIPSRLRGPPLIVLPRGYRAERT